MQRQVQNRRQHLARRRLRPALDHGAQEVVQPGLADGHVRHDLAVDNAVEHGLAADAARAPRLGQPPRLAPRALHGGVGDAGAPDPRREARGQQLEEGELLDRRVRAELHGRGEAGQRAVWRAAPEGGEGGAAVAPDDDVGDGDGGALDVLGEVGGGAQEVVEEDGVSGWRVSGFAGEGRGRVRILGFLEGGDFGVERAWLGAAF